MSDDYPARLRALVDEALPVTPIDPNLALAVARRRTRRTRGRYTAVSVAVAAVVVSGAVAVPVLVTDESPLVVAATRSVELAPGIRAATSMVAVERDGGGAVYDTGIAAWGTDDRFLFTTDDDLITGLYVGGDDDFERLREDEVVALIKGPPQPVWAPAENSSSAPVEGVEAAVLAPGGTDLIVLSSPDDSWRLVLGADTADSARHSSSSSSTHLVTRDMFTGPDGSQVSNVVLPTSAFTRAPRPTDLVYFAAVAHNTHGRAPDFAGTVSQTIESNSGAVYSWGASGCWGEECTMAAIWGPTTGAVTEERVLDATTIEVQERLEELPDDPEVWQRECVEIRTRADEDHQFVRTDLDRVTQCRLDTAQRSADLVIENSDGAPS